MSCVCEACEEGVETVEMRYKRVDSQEPGATGSVHILLTRMVNRGDWRGQLYPHSWKGQEAQGPLALNPCAASTLLYNQACLCSGVCFAAFAELSNVCRDVCLLDQLVAASS